MIRRVLTYLIVSVFPWLALADDFDNLEGPALAEALKSAQPQATDAISIADLGRLPRVFNGLRSTALLARTGEGNPARLVVTAALRQPVIAPSELNRKTNNAEAKEPEPIPILVLERFETFEGNAARNRLAHGREIVLFDGFQYDLDNGQVVPDSSQGADLRFNAANGGRLEAVGGAKLFTLTTPPRIPAPEPGQPSTGKAVIPGDFAGRYRLFANGQLSGTLDLSVAERGETSGRFRSDQTGQSYKVTGQVALDKPERIHFAIQFPRSRQEYDGRLWTEGKGAMTGSVILLDREHGFFAVREGGRITPEAAAEALALPSAKTPPNIVFIAIDDLNDWVGPLGGHPQARTPNMDRLARRGVTFTNAHCQAPLCNPSRASFMTGLRPSTTGVYALNPWFRTDKRWADLVTLPQYFMKHGYQALTCGKLYHDAYPPPEGRKPNTEFTYWGYHGTAGPRPPKKFINTPDPHPLVDWGAFPERDDQMDDWKIADCGIEQIQAKPKQPFLLSVGFRRPHVPCYAPQKWFDLYPDATLKMPPIKLDDRDDTPGFSWYLHWRLPEPRLAWLQSAGQWRALVQAYLASVSFVDSQVGRVLDAIEANGLNDNTYIVMISDHGWHLGEKLITGKNTLWEESTRVPLIIAGPGIGVGGVCKQPAELLDLYPTLVDLCDLPAKGGLEGHSLAPQLHDVAAPRAWPAITTHGPNNHSVRDERYRYIRYADGSEELYDLETDPNEWTNLAADPARAELKQRLAKWLPKSSTPPIAGSVLRLIDVRDGVPFWEGKPIGRDEPIPQ